MVFFLSRHPVFADEPSLVLRQMLLRGQVKRGITSVVRQRQHLGNERKSATRCESLRDPRLAFVEQVVRELKLIGFSDIRKVVSWRNELVTRTEKGKDGEPVMVLIPRVTIVDADKISDEAAAAVAEVSQTVNGALRVKMHDKHAALVLIGRYLGMFDAKVKVDAVYGISEEPMSAEEWKKQFAGN